MICKNCNNEISDASVFCPYCGYQLEKNLHKKPKNKKSLKVFLIVLGAVVMIPILIVLISVLAFTFSKKPVVSDVSVQNDQIYLGQESTFTVTYNNESGYEREQEFEIMVDGNHYVNEVIGFTDETPKSISYTLNGLGLGTHKVTAGDYSQEFEVVEYNDFEIQCEEVNLMVKEIPREVFYRVLNVGDFEGIFDIDISVDGQTLVEESVFVEKYGMYEDSFVIQSSNDTIELSVNGNKQIINIYNETKMDHGKKLMDNTVKGYGYFIINNDSSSDVVYYVVEKENPSVAVAAAYIKAGKSYEFKSFPHGTYNTIVQAGNHWVSELNAFADQYYIVKGKEDLVFKNNVSKEYGGTYTYWTITLADGLNMYEDYYEVLESAPKLGN